jgi:hypothetical protein
VRIGGEIERPRRDRRRLVVLVGQVDLVDR